MFEKYLGKISFSKLTLPLFFVIALIIFGGIVSRFFNGFNITSSAPATASVYTSQTILTNLQLLGQLVTISAEVAQADIQVGIKGGVLNFCGHGANHVAHGVIEAGINIMDLDENDISYDEENNHYTITLPAPAITSCRIEYIRQYERVGGGNIGCQTDWDTVRMLAQTVVMKAFVDDVLERGLLEQAKQQSTIVMSTFVSTLTNAQVTINYSEDNAVTLPSSCLPQPPSGWIFDEENRTWYRE